MARAELLDAGLSPKAIEHRLRTGRLHPLHRGIYAVGHLAPSPYRAAQAALLACGPGCIMVSLTAAVLWALLTDDGGPIHVARVGGHREVKGVRLHRLTTLPPTVLRHGLPVTAPLQTLRDLPQHLRDRATDAALARRLVRPEDVATNEGFTRSEAERRLLALLHRAQLPRPRTNVRLEGHEVDALWPDQRLVVEIDGYAAHSSRRAFEADRRRDATLQLQGYRVLRLTWRQLADQPEAAAATLGAALA